MKRAHRLQEWSAHENDVRCLHIGRRSGSLLATGGDDKNVNVWAVGKPHALVSLSGHTSPVECVAFDASEEVLVAGAAGGTLKIWDPEEGRVVRTLTGHRSNVVAVAFHPFGEFFASGSHDTSLRVWDVRQRTCVHTYGGHSRAVTHLAFSPDGRWVVSGGLDGAVKLWDLAAGKVLHQFPSHAGCVTAVDFHPREFLLATASADRSARLWDLETWALVAEAGPEPSPVRAATFSPCGAALLLAGADGLSSWGWEPSACHDGIAAPWRGAQDMTVVGSAAGSPGRLLLAAAYNSFVSLWVAELGRMAPWAPAGGELAADRAAEGRRGGAEPPPALPPVVGGAAWARPEEASRAAAAATADGSAEESDSGSPPDRIARPSIDGSAVLSPSQLRRAMRRSAGSAEAPAEAESAALWPTSAAAALGAGEEEALSSALAAHAGLSARLALRRAHLASFAAALPRGGAELRAALQRCAGEEAALAGCLRSAAPSGWPAADPQAAAALLPLLPRLLQARHEPHAVLALQAARACLARPPPPAARAELAGLREALRSLAHAGGPLSVEAGEVAATAAALLAAPAA